MKKIFIMLLSVAALTATAQTDSSENPVKLSAYIETYYSYDFGKPLNGNRPGFVYSHNRHNEFNLNLGYVKAACQTEKIRANLSLAAGTYMNANYAAEPGVLRNVYEANAGVKISKKNNLWIDAGIMPSHIGFESAIRKDCWTLTRSLLADNSPYYETGAKISYTSGNSKWFISALVLNGWQRIQRVAGNSTPAFGHQLTYKPTANITLNSSSFIGNDKPDSVKQMRYFHNFYGIFQLTEKLALTTGFDIGAEQKTKGSNRYNSWYSPVILLRAQTGSKSYVTARGEYYNDGKAVIINTGTAKGFQTWGYSVNYDYHIAGNMMWCVEARGFTARDEIFKKDNTASKQNFFITTAFAISF